MSSINDFYDPVMAKELQRIYSTANNLAAFNFPPSTTAYLAAQAQLASLVKSFNNLSSYTQIALTAQNTFNIVSQYQQFLQNAIGPYRNIYRQIRSSSHYNQTLNVDKIESSVEPLLSEIQSQSSNSTLEIKELKNRTTTSITSLSSYLPSSDKLNVKEALEFLLLIITLPDVGDDTNLLQYCIQWALILVIISRFFSYVSNQENIQSIDTEK